MLRIDSIPTSWNCWLAVSCDLEKLVQFAKTCKCSFLFFGTDIPSANNSKSEFSYKRAKNAFCSLTSNTDASYLIAAAFPDEFKFMLTILNLSPSFSAIQGHTRSNSSFMVCSLGRL